MKFQRSFVIPLALALLLNAGCTKKPVVAKAPSTPEPTATAERTTTTSPAPVRTQPTERAAAPATQASNYPSKETRDRIDVLIGRISDAYFDYDKSALRADAMSTLQADSNELRDILKQYPGYKLVIQGYADERGSEEYNLGLGDARAAAAKSYLVHVGIPGDQLSVVSFGKDKPVCTDHTEECWQKNRRIHIVAQDKQPV